MARAEPDAFSTLITIAPEIGRDIVEFTFLAVLKERLEKENRQEPCEQDWNIVIEFVAFLLHVTNRAAFACVPSNRAAFMDLCVFNAWTYLIERMVHPDEPGREEIRDKLVGIFNDRETEYANYRWTVPETQAMKDYLFWEFGNRIARMEGEEESFTAAAETSLKALAMVGSLKLDKRLQASGLH